MLVIQLHGIVLAECVMQESIVSNVLFKIDERSSIRRDVIPAAKGRKCLVDLKVRIGRTWYTAIGEYEWDGAEPDSVGCARAVAIAEQRVEDRLIRDQQVTKTQTLICKDRPELKQLSESNIGSTGDVAQFRPHPNYLNKFHYNGTICKWFIDSQFNRGDMKLYQGVICQLGDNSWVVVDKF